MKVHLYDNTPAAPGEKHGERGPTHCADITVDYEYQVEMWVEEIEQYQTEVVRIECPTLRREWLRNAEGKFVETKPPPPRRQEVPQLFAIIPSKD